MKAREVTRHISQPTQNQLWGQAAGRCQFRGCNRLLYRSPVTQETVNLAEKAHIHSFSEKGPRGRGRLAASTPEVNSITNLLLVCHDCHRKIDQDIAGTRYPATLLKEWKHQHETRVRAVTGISPDFKSTVLLYGAKIGEQPNPLCPDAALESMFPQWYPAEGSPLSLSMRCSHDDSLPDYWKTEADHLRKEFELQVRPRIERADGGHLSVFAIGPQPLLVLLGSLITDKVPAEVYQLHREPQTWRWQPESSGVQFGIGKPQAGKRGKPALVFSLSARIDHGRVTKILGRDTAVWELACSRPGNDFLRSKAQLSAFREAAREALAGILSEHPGLETLPVFPAMPVACAVELGRVWMPKANPSLLIYDQHRRRGGFAPTLTIGAPHE
ncbi:MAG TPA: SAVED domain-containing protein [Verrucomicrobiota bacterium]|nr:SAVED domain-containing protein [Verrucomicrobiota bacterium]